VRRRTDYSRRRLGGWLRRKKSGDERRRRNRGGRRKRNKRGGLRKPRRSTKDRRSWQRLDQERGKQWRLKTVGRRQKGSWKAQIKK
jgi:hypothetical protein